MNDSGWESRMLQELASVERGKFTARPRNDPKYFGGSVPFVQTGDVANSGGYLRNYTQTLNAQGLAVSRLFKRGTILVTIAANIGEVAVLEIDAACPDSVVAVQPFSTVDRIWLAFALQFKKEELDWCSNQNAQKTINLEDLRPLRIKTPPLPEQRAIAAVLSAWDRGIRQVTDLIAAKIRLKQGLMQQLLTGKRRFPGFTFSKQVYQHVRLQEVLEKVADSVTPATDCMYREIGIRSHGKGIFHKGPVTGESLENKRVYRVIPGCRTLNIVFAWERALAVTSECEDGMIASHRFPMFRPDSRRLLAEYALLYLLSTNKGSEALELASPGGAGRNRTLSQSEFLKIRIPLPSLAEQRKIVALVQAADREIDLLRKQLGALKRQKKGLMQKLLTGKLRVSVQQ